MKLYRVQVQGEMFVVAENWVEAEKVARAKSRYDAEHFDCEAFEVVASHAVPKGREHPWLADGVTEQPGTQKTVAEWKAELAGEERA